MKAPVSAFLLAALLLLPGCAKRETDVAAGIRTQTLLVGNNAEPTSLDPHLATMITDQTILLALFEGLTALDEKTGQAVAGVAERWDVSPDGCVYTFPPPPHGPLSNGDPVTAHDFAFAFQRILSPTLGANYSYMLWSIRNAEAFNKGKLADFAAVGIEVVDAHTLRLRLERPTAYLPALAAHNTWLPVHQATLEKLHAVADRNAAWARPGALIGNGPFTLTEWRPDVRVVVTRNPHYWNAAQNRLARVVFLPIESPDVEERNFRAGQMHLTAGLPIPKIARWRDRDPARLRVDPFSATWYLSFNVTKPPLDNPKVRRALTLAIDRDAIARRVFAGSRQPAFHYTPPDLAGYTARARVPTDFAAARQLLAAAGFPRGAGLPGIELQADNYIEQPRVAEVIQETWRRELGVRLQIAVLEAKTKIQNRRTGNYAISFSMWNAEFADPASFLEVFVTNGGNNVTRWSHPGYDRLIAEAAQTLDPARRFEVFQQAEALLLEEAPIAPVFFDAQTYLVHPAVRNWEPAPLGYHRFQRVWLEP